MSVRYQAVNWNRQKRIYDLVLAAGVALAVVVFALVSLSAPHATVETSLIRGLGLTAFLLLHLILIIGPLARLDHRFLPLLYNRRHLGVTMALLATAHAGFAVFQYHAGGEVNPVVSLLQGAPTTRFPGEFPFEYLGLAAWLIVLLMAATSHDFWLSILTPRVWKSLHMLVYVAYGLLLLHVALGAGQAGAGRTEVLLLGGAGLVFGLHITAGLREWGRDSAGRESRAGRVGRTAGASEWIDAGPVEATREGRAVSVMVNGERVAIFRHQGRLSAVSAVCRHQNGPLDEGRIIDGCITCPWHGYQYRPEDGRSPPPYDDRLATYQLEVRNSRVWVLARANAPGTPVPPVSVGSGEGATA